MGLRVATALLLVLLTGCATLEPLAEPLDPWPAPAWLHLGLAPYQIGDYRVLVTAPHVAHRYCVKHGKTARAGTLLRGCQIDQPTAYVLIGAENAEQALGAYLMLHELKHTVDGPWHP